MVGRRVKVEDRPVLGGYILAKDCVLGPILQEGPWPSSALAIRDTCFFGTYDNGSNYYERSLGDLCVLRLAWTLFMWEGAHPIWPPRACTWQTTTPCSG